MVTTVACYIINEGYLLPALVSAIQARKYSSKDLMDVVIYVAGTPTDLGRKAIDVAEKNGVIITYIPASFQEGKPPHYGRLLIHKIMDPRYKRIIYIDGDTQVAGSLDPLATAELAPGKFMAVRDPSIIFAELSPKWHKLIEKDRIKVGYEGVFGDYFNTGMLVINREGWPELAERAMALYDGLSSRLVHFDQDLMNLTLSEHCVLIPNRWNFPGFLIGSPMEKRTKPIIYHFMSNPRPWNDPVAPWGYKFMKPYDDLLKANPQLKALKPKRPLLKRIKYTLQQIIKIANSYGPVGRRSEAKANFEV